MELGRLGRILSKKAYWFGDVDDRERTDWNTLGWKQKKQVFHYAIFIHSLQGVTWTGLAETPGNDFVVSLGNAPQGTGSAGNCESLRRITYARIRPQFKSLSWWNG